MVGDEVFGGGSVGEGMVGPHEVVDRFEAPQTGGEATETLVASPVVV